MGIELGVGINLALGYIEPNFQPFLLLLFCLICFELNLRILIRRYGGT